MMQVRNPRISHISHRLRGLTGAKFGSPCSRAGRAAKHLVSGHALNAQLSFRISVSFPLAKLLREHTTSLASTTTFYKLRTQPASWTGVSYLLTEPLCALVPPYLRIDVRL